MHAILSRRVPGSDHRRPSVRNLLLEDRTTGRLVPWGPPGWRADSVGNLTGGCSPGSRYTCGMHGPSRTRDGIDRPDSLYFFPDQKVTEAEVRHLLRHGTVEQRAWVISHLLRYAQWDDIWTY